MKEQRPIKTVPMDAESDSPLTHGLMDPIHKELPVLPLDFLKGTTTQTGFILNHHTYYYNIIFNFQAQTTTNPYLKAD